jgi:hypothetical protein
MLNVKKHKVKSVYFAIVILLLILCILCIRNILSFGKEKLSSRTDSWQTVAVDRVGSFRVPEEWTVEQEGKIIFITDRPRQYGDYVIYIVGYVWEWEWMEEGHEVEYPIFNPPELFDGIERDRILYNYNFSNSTSVSIYNFVVNGIEERCILIDMPNGRGNEFSLLELLVLNQAVVNEEIAIDIAKTFRRETANSAPP